MTPEQFLELARVLPEPLLLVSGSGQILAINQPVVDMLELRPQELRRKTLFEIVTEPPEKIITYLQACASSRAMVLGSLTLRKNDRQTLICRSQGALIQPWSAESSDLILLRLENKAVACSNFVLLNQKIDELAKEITRRIQVEEALLKTNEELELRVEKRTTALKETLNELQRTQTHLIQTEKMSSLGQMVAGVAHEINNPVTFIQSNLTYAQQYTEDLLRLVQLYQQYYPKPPQEIQEEIEVIDLDFLMPDLTKVLNSMTVRTERIQEIVKSLLNFSRLNEAELKKVDIHEGIDSTLMILGHRLQATHEHPEIKVIKEYAQLPLVECYPGQLNQVFMNIIDNAIDALSEGVGSREWGVGGVGGEITPSSSSSPSTSSSLLTDSSPSSPPTPYSLLPTPQIHIRTELLDDNWVAITIADNGPGMNEQVRSKLFDPFFTTKPVGKGAGIGLSISYQIIVEKHGGQLSFISAPEQGAFFVIKIPVDSLDSS